MRLSDGQIRISKGCDRSTSNYTATHLLNGPSTFHSTPPPPIISRVLNPPLHSTYQPPLQKNLSLFLHSPATAKTTATHSIAVDRLSEFNYKHVPPSWLSPRRDYGHAGAAKPACELLGTVGHSTPEERLRSLQTRCLYLGNCSLVSHRLGLRPPDQRTSTRT